MPIQNCKLSLAASLMILIGGGLAVAQQQREAPRPQPQRRDNRDAEQIYVISAKAGNVSFADGAVQVTRAAAKTTETLAKNQVLNNQDQISTGATGKVEVLLNPGSFLRLAENSTLEITDTALESLRFKLFAGSALFEAAGVGEDGAEVVVTTPQTVIKLEKSGVYRINVDGDATQVVVWKGAATVNGEMVKGKRKTVFKDGLGTTAKFEKDVERDRLDVWSKERAKELAKLNERLQQRTLARAFNGFSDNFGDRFGSGYWVFNRQTTSYCFVPRGWSYWNSPYGFGYNQNISLGQQPRVISPQMNYPAHNPASMGSPAAGLPASGSPAAGSPAMNSPASQRPDSMPSRPMPGSRIHTKNQPINPD